MSKVFTVAVREFIETVKTKTFLFSSVLLPLLMIALIFGGQRVAEIAEKEKVPTRVVAVDDQRGYIFDGLAERVEQHNQEVPQRKFAIEKVTGKDADVNVLRNRVRRGDIYAYLIIPAAAALPCEFGRMDSQLQAQIDFQEMVNDVVVEARFERADPPVDRERIRRLQRKVDFRYVDVATGQETTGDEMTRFLAPFAFMFLLFMGTMTISHGLLTSVIEEKSSRVIEVLLSAVSPIELMAGKILGMVAVGGVLIVIWGGVGYGSAQTRDLDYLVTPYRLTYMVLYFIPGFLLTSAFLAAVGSACNSIKEAQSMAAPLTLLTIVPMMLWWAITQNPNSMLSIVLSYIPPITPFVMILRICADPEISLLEIVATLVLLWASVVGMIWVAGKIFRVGVLMYGKPPSPKEVFRWLCYE